MIEIALFPYPSPADPWIGGPAAELYPALESVPKLPSVYYRAADILYRNGKKQEDAVAAIEGGYLGCVLIYEPQHPARYRFYPHGDAAKLMTTLPMRILRAAVNDSPANIPLPHRLATAAWMLFSWFELRETSE